MNYFSSWNAPVLEFCSPRLPNESQVSYACVCLAMDICTIFSWWAHNTPFVQDFRQPNVSSYANSVPLFRHNCLCTNIWSVRELWFEAQWHVYFSLFVWSLAACSVVYVLLLLNIAFKHQNEKWSVRGSLWAFVVMSLRCHFASVLCTNMNQQVPPTT